MTFAEIFKQYYTLYRAEAQTPDVTDDEYTIAISFANEAIRRWSNYESTYWNELWKKATLTSVAGTDTYTAPTDMKRAGGYIMVGSRRLPILEPQDAQFRGTQSAYAYFTGSQGNGFTLNFNTGNITSSGLPITFVYYKKAALVVDGTSIPEMSNAEMMVHRMLAMRFRASRNWTAYQTSLRDSEDTLKSMKLDNDTGTWANPFSLPDNTGMVFGGDSNSNSFWS